jgi:hypothetical protein
VKPALSTRRLASVAGCGPGKSRPIASSRIAAASVAARVSSRFERITDAHVALGDIGDMGLVAGLAPAVAEHGEAAVAPHRQAEAIVDGRAVAQPRPLGHRRGHGDATDRTRRECEHPARQVLGRRGQRVGRDAEEVGRPRPPPAPSGT